MNWNHNSSKNTIDKVELHRVRTMQLSSCDKIVKERQFEKISPAQIVFYVEKANELKTNKSTKSFKINYLYKQSRSGIFM